METVSGHTRLMRRKATYYHRAKVPLDILDSYGKSEETFSLKTKDYHQALKLVRVAAVEVDKKFETHRRSLNRPTYETLSDDQLEQLKQAFIRCLLEENDASRAQGYEQAPRETKFISNDVLNDRAAFDEAFLEAGFKVYLDETIENTKSALATVKQKYSSGTVDHSDRDDLEEMLELEYINIRLVANSPSIRPAMAKLQEAQIEAYQTILNRFNGIYSLTENHSQPLPEAPSMPRLTSTAHIISKVAKEWITEKSRSEWRPKTKVEHEIWIDQFISFSGDRPIDSYTKADGRNFKAMLLKLPSNWKKKKQIRSLPIIKAAEKAHKLEMPPMSDANVNKIMAKVGAFWNWAKKSYDEIQGNPLDGLQIRLKKNVRAERDPFTVNELNQLFASPLYQGCNSHNKIQDKGDLILFTSAKYWLPLIGLFSGMRMNEILQLYTSDIKQEGDVLFFDINEQHEGKSLKTATSTRRIPIHHTLIELGLTDFLKGKEGLNDARIFSDIPKATDGYYSSNFSKWFNRYLKHLTIKHTKLTFHSFRHNFEDACRSARIDKAIMDALQGHTEKGMSGRYGRGYELKILDEEIQKINYNDLSLQIKR